MDIVKLIFDMVLAVFDPANFKQDDPVMMCALFYAVAISIIYVLVRLFNAFRSLDV